ncbi:MAG TPA: peroxiredoxin [Burkholderiaceae bacterium]|jgi:peroxiredoxin (alkyl hydroperoxide reductase subunit C)|nr:peroxiredoxin [Burkholderiaceae bacterium]
MIAIGQRLPTVRADALWPDGSIAPLDLDAWRRDHWLVLFFYPLDFTFVCPTEIRGFAALHQRFAASGVRVVGASIDSAYAHRAWCRTELGALPFPLLADVDRALAGACGVLAPEGFAQRATLIADPDGIVQSVTATASQVGRSAQETLRQVQALQAGGLAPCDWQPGQPLLQAA